MKISCEKLPDMVEVKISGRLTHKESGTVSEFIEARIGEGFRHVLVNLDVGFFSAVGLGSIVGFHSKLKEMGGELAVYSLKKPVFEKLCHVPYGYPVFWGTREEAVEFLFKSEGGE